LAAITRLRQICCHPSLCINNYKGGSGKLDITIDTIVSCIESGHRVLLFSQFTSMIKIIEDTLHKKEIRYFSLNGTTEAKNRIDMVERFNNLERDLFIVSLKAGGTGLNLTGADVVIHFDQWWNPAVMNQATDRSHRFGQTKVVQVFNIVSNDSIEEKIMLLQEKKKGLVDAVIFEGTTFINKLSEDEIKNLFAD
jgi:SNF2 family DNA or RNA helicase